MDEPTLSTEFAILVKNFSKLELEIKTDYIVLIKYKMLRLSNSCAMMLENLLLALSLVREFFVHYNFVEKII